MRVLSETGKPIPCNRRLKAQLSQFRSGRTFSIVSGVLPSVIMAIFGFLLPIFMRRLSKYQGATTRSRLDRAVMARYFAFMIISNFVIFSLLGVIWSE